MHKTTSKRKKLLYVIDNVVDIIWTSTGMNEKMSTFSFFVTL